MNRYSEVMVTALEKNQITHRIKGHLAGGLFETGWSVLVVFNWDPRNQRKDCGAKNWGKSKE